MDENKYTEQNGENPEAAPETENLELPVSLEEDYVIGKGFEITEHEATVSSGKSKRDKHSKGSSPVKTIIWILSIIVVSIGLALGVIYAGADYMGIGFGRGKDCVIEIEQGMSTSQIAERLKEAGAVKLPFMFRVYAKLKSYDSQFKYGVYNFNTEAGYEALAEMLITDGAKAESVNVTIKEMTTVDEIAALLEENGVCTKSDFINEVQNGEFDYDFLKDIPFEKVYYRLEGYLFPDTYDFYKYDSKECAHLAVDKMLANLDSKLTADIREKIASSGYTLHEIMTMASIVESESGGSADEMANVAAVFFNRLKSDDFDKLQSSPSKKYPYGNGRYDTYQCEGLPPGPICSPGLNSIKASVYPTENFDYYFFCTDAKMEFHYNKTNAQHEATIAKLKRENNWFGDR